MMTMYPEWLALAPWVIAAVLAAERLAHLTDSRTAGRWFSFAFILAAAGGLLTLSRETSSVGAMVTGTAALICAVSGGAHLGILIICDSIHRAGAK
jgi:hypothetical protein